MRLKWSALKKFYLQSDEGKEVQQGYTVKRLVVSASYRCLVQLG